MQNERPTQLCPYCKAVTEADFVDVGVGLVQCGPYHCERCGASEIGPHDEPRCLQPFEEELGWYMPGSEPGSSANVIEGRHVSHEAMRAEYHRAFAGNPMWHDKDYVDEWWNNIRRKI